MIDYCCGLDIDTDTDTELRHRTPTRSLTSMTQARDRRYEQAAVRTGVYAGGYGGCTRVGGQVRTRWVGRWVPRGGAYLLPGRVFGS